MVAAVYVVNSYRLCLQSTGIICYLFNFLKIFGSKSLKKPRGPDYILHFNEFSFFKFINLKGLKNKNNINFIGMNKIIVCE